MSRGPWRLGSGWRGSITGDSVWVVAIRKLFRRKARGLVFSGSRTPCAGTALARQPSIAPFPQPDEYELNVFALT